MNDVEFPAYMDALLFSSVVQPIAKVINGLDTTRLAKQGRGSLSHVFYRTAQLTSRKAI